MTNLRAMVVDDEPLARDELTFLLGECGIEVVAQAGDAKSAIAACTENSPNVAFVDLRMPGPDGLALTEALRARFPGLSAVLVSAHDEGALRAFEVGVVDYLLKPVRLERLRRTLERVRSAVLGNEQTAAEPLRRLAVRRRGNYVVLDIDQVVYFEVRDELVWAVTSDDRFALDLSLAALEQRLEPGSFFRTHRACLVRLTRIGRIEPSGSGLYALVLDHPESPRVPLARERARTLRSLIPFTG